MIRDLIFSCLMAALFGTLAYPKFSIGKSITIGIVMGVVVFIIVHTLDIFRP